MAHPSDLAEDCVVCGTPLAGALGALLRPLGIRRSGRNPNICSRCQIHVEDGRVVELTVLFADLTGFTGLTEQLGPERAHQVTNAFLEMASAAIARHDGYVDKYIGDAVMALFNAPVRRADHAALAVDAALDIQAAMPALARAHGLELRAGIGIGTGHARVGKLGSSERGDFTVIGNAVNIAARLEGRADGGEIVVDAGVYAAVAGRFPDAPAEMLELKGIAEPVTARRLLRPGERGEASAPQIRKRRGLRARAPAAALAVLGAPCAAGAILGPAATALGAASAFTSVAAPVLSALDQAAVRLPLLAFTLVATALNLAALAQARSRRREARIEGLAAAIPPAERRRARVVIASAAFSLAAVALELWTHHHGHGSPW